MPILGECCFLRFSLFLGQREQSNGHGPVLYGKRTVFYRKGMGVSNLGNYKRANC